MEGRHDPDCRRSFPWDERAWDRDLLAYVQAATAVRHAQPSLREGDFSVLAAEGNAVAWVRSLNGSPSIVTALNAGSQRAALSFPLPAGMAGLSPAAAPLAASARASVDLAASRATIEIGPRSAAILVAS